VPTGETVSTRILCGRDAGFLLTRLTGQGQAGSVSAFAPAVSADRVPDVAASRVLVPLQP